jgi:hypothetical protein
MGFPMAVNLKKAGFGANRLFHPYAHEHIETLNLPLERGRRPASRSRHIDLHPARRDRRMADLPGRGEHRSFRQSPRHRQLPSGPLGDRGPTRSARRRWKPFQRPSLLRTAYPAPGS